MHDIAIIVQARTGSTRLPQKIILPFWRGKSILQMILERLSPLPWPIILATTTSKGDDPLEQFASERITLFRGSEEDVLWRFIEAAKQYKIKNVIRICADNPFIDLSLLQALVKHHNGDYTSFWHYDKPTILTHFGVFGEVVSTAALKKAYEFSKDPFYCEHVTRYIYSHPDSFKINSIATDKELFFSEDIRLTVDTALDFKFASDIFSKMKKRKLDINMKNIGAILRENPHYFDLMRREINQGQGK